MGQIPKFQEPCAQVLASFSARCLAEIPRKRDRPSDDYYFPAACFDSSNSDDCWGRAPQQTLAREHLDANFWAVQADSARD